MAKIKKFDMKKRKMASFDALPAGEYLAEIVESEWVETKSGDGEYLKLTFEITKGDYKGQKFWENLNLDNPNEDAVRIAEGTLADINRACGYGEKLQSDSEKFHGKSIIIKLGVKSDKQYGDRNTLKAVINPKEKKKDSGDDSPPWEDDSKKEKKGKQKDKGGKKKKDKKKK